MKYLLITLKLLIICNMIFVIFKLHKYGQKTGKGNSRFFWEGLCFLYFHVTRLCSNLPLGTCLVRKVHFSHVQLNFRTAK